MFKIPSKLLKCGHVIQTLRSRGDAACGRFPLVDIFINGKPVKVPAYYTIMQALRKERVAIPSFCYHERLSIAGNCRMCLIEVEGMMKPQIACGVPVMKGMKLRTNSEITMKAQESVLEFILVDHPLDCPICDQGGECDLQDLTMRFGNDRSRFTDIHFKGKRAVEDKNYGPLIRAEMTRCIHCTRCIRFGAQVCGVEVLGSTGRGADMLIGSYVDKMFLSELSGNIIDLCPVGALTAKPYLFKARPWELKRTNSIDVTDATGTNIQLNYRFDRVIRVLPREHEEVNMEWVSDKGRWAIDSLEMQRLVTPMTRDSSRLHPVEWDVALRKAACILNDVDPDEIMLVAGPHTNVETLVVAKDFVNMLGSENAYIERGLAYTNSGSDIRAAYSLNVCMSDVARADRILLVGTNPRFEAPILNAWIRQAYRTNECDIYVIGPECDYNYFVNYLGDGPEAICKASEILNGARNPIIFVGVAQLEKCDRVHMMRDLVTMASCIHCAHGWGVFNVISREASFSGALEAGYKPGAKQALKQCPPKVLISLGADDILCNWNPKDCEIIYIGFQGDMGAHYAKVVLPGSAYTEAGGTFMNMEGRVQFASPAVTPPGHARYDWKILRALAEYAGICLFYCDEQSLCFRMSQISPNFVCLDRYQAKMFADLVAPMVSGHDKNKTDLCVDMPTLKHYYCSDVFTRLSTTMIKAQRAACEYEKLAYAKN